MKHLTCQGKPQCPPPSPGHCLQQSVGLARTGWAQASRGHCTFSQWTSPVPPCRDPLRESVRKEGEPPASSLSFSIPQMSYFHGPSLRSLDWCFLHLNANAHGSPSRQPLPYLLIGIERGVQGGTEKARALWSESAGRARIHRHVSPSLFLQEVDSPSSKDFS